MVLRTHLRFIVMNLTWCDYAFSSTTFSYIETSTEMARVGFNQWYSFAVMKRDDNVIKHVHEHNIWQTMGVHMGNDVAGIAYGKSHRSCGPSRLAGKWTEAIVTEDVTSPFIGLTVHGIGSFNSLMEKW